MQKEARGICVSGSPRDAPFLLGSTFLAQRPAENKSAPPRAICAIRSSLHRAKLPRRLGYLRRKQRAFPVINDSLSSSQSGGINSHAAVPGAGRGLGTPPEL